MTRKEFKYQADIHIYGHGLGAIKVLYFDRDSGEINGTYFAGFKYAIAAQGISQVDLLKMAYDRIILNRVVSHSGWSGHRVAKTDLNRFKVPISFSSTAGWKYSQEDY